MNGQTKPIIVVICVSITGTSQASDYYKIVENFFQGCDARRFIKVSDGTYLAAQDACYPAILQIIAYCNRSKDVPGQPTARLMIAELSECPVVLSPDHQDAQSLVREMGRQVRLTKFPPPAPQPPNKPIQPPA